MNERSTVEVLRAARERISDPERWTQHRLSDTVPHGYEPEQMRRGSCWCAMGALICEAGSIGQYLDAADYLPGGGTWNDSHTHAEVVAAFDCAIEVAEAEA